MAPFDFGWASRRSRGRRSCASTLTSNEGAGNRPGRGYFVKYFRAPSKLRSVMSNLTWTALLLRVRSLQALDVNLLHLEHRLHDSLGLLPVLIADQLG